LVRRDDAARTFNLAELRIMSPSNIIMPCAFAVASALILTCIGCRPVDPSRPPDRGSILDTTAADPTSHASLEDGGVLDRARLICAVLAANPDLAATREAWRAQRAATRSPTALGDTSLSYSLAPASIGSRAVPYGQVIEIRQSFVLGQASAERRVARAQSDVAEQRWHTQRQELALMATTLYDEYYAIERALETNTEHRALVGEMLDVSTARYSTGRTGQQDPIQAELELAHMDHERVVLVARRDIVTAQINGLLHRPPQTSLPASPDRLSAGSERAADVTASRPEQQAAIAAETASAEATSLARRRFAPSLSAMASYNSMWAMVQHQFMVGVGISIPLQLRSLRAGVEEAESRRRAAHYARQAIDDRIAVELAQAEHRLQEAGHVERLHRTRLLPSARQRVDAARVGYETGANSFSDVIEAERELRSLELEYHRALADLDRRRAELDFAVGRRPPCDDAEVQR
jgi:cobalt-zinc-cadmium efflux system outer membrane protein